MEFERGFSGFSFSKTPLRGRGGQFVQALPPGHPVCAGIPAASSMAETDSPKRFNTRFGFGGFVPKPDPKGLRCSTLLPLWGFEHKNLRSTMLGISREDANPDVETSRSLGSNIPRPVMFQSGGTWVTKDEKRRFAHT